MLLSAHVSSVPARVGLTCSLLLRIVNTVCMRIRLNVILKSLFACWPQGSFGLQAHCTLEPGVVVIASKGQPMSLSYDPRLPICLFASEAEALAVPIDTAGAATTGSAVYFVLSIACLLTSRRHHFCTCGHPPSFANCRHRQFLCRRCRLLICMTFF